MKWSLAFLGVLCALVGAERLDDSIEYIDVPGNVLRTRDSNESGDSDDYDSIEYVDSTEVAERPANTELLGEVSPPECDCEGYRCSCCSNVTINGELRDFCLEGWVDTVKFAVGLDIIFSGNTVKTFEISAQTIGKICAPIPFPPPFNEIVKLCVGNYHLRVDLDKGSAMVCLFAQVNVVISLFTVDFKCLKYENSRFSIDTSIEFEGKGLINFDVDTLEFEVNLPDEVKEFVKNEAERIVTEFKKKETLGEQVEFVAETYWRYTPLKYIIDGVVEIAPEIPNAAEYAVKEAGKAIEDFAKQCSHDLSKIDRVEDKVAYMVKRLYKFTPAGLLHEGYKKISPFVEGVAKFTFKKISTALETLVVDILTEASKIEDPGERALFLAKKYVEYTPAGLIAKAVGPAVTSIANKAVEKISNLAEDVRDNLIANLTRMDNPIDQTYHVLKTFYKFTPMGMLLSGAESQLDAAYEAAKKGVVNIANNAADDIVSGYEKAETTGDKILHVADTAYTFLNPIYLGYKLWKWG